MNQGVAFVTVIALLCSGCLSGREPNVQSECRAPEFAPPILLGDVGPAGFASEPAIAFGPNGELAVASIWIPAAFLPAHAGFQYIGFASQMAAGMTLEQGGQNAVWFSTDGASFQPLHNALGRITLDGHQGNQDADLVFTPSGALHVALYGPNGIEVLTTRDQGASWIPSGLLSPQAVDRQWIEVGADNSILVSWRGLSTIANLAPKPAEIGSARSLDDGATWSDVETILLEGFSRGPATRHEGGFAMGVNEGDEAELRVALGHAASWELQTTGIDVQNEPGFVVPVSRSNGELFLTWTDDATPARILAAEQAASGVWSEAFQVSPEGMNAVFAWPVEHAGKLVVFYYLAEGDGPPTEGVRNWSLGMSWRCDQGQWNHGLVQQEPVHHGSMCFAGNQCAPLNYDASQNDRSVGEIFEAGVDANGRLWVTWTATTAGDVRSNQIWIAGTQP